MAKKKHDGFTLNSLVDEITLPKSKKIDASYKTYSFESRKKNLQRRFNQVKDMLVEAGIISPEMAKENRKVPIELKPYFVAMMSVLVNTDKETLNKLAEGTRDTEVVKLLDDIANGVKDAILTEYEGEEQEEMLKAFSTYYEEDFWEIDQEIREMTKNDLSMLIDVKDELPYNVTLAMIEEYKRIQQEAFQAWRQNVEVAKKYSFLYSNENIMNLVQKVEKELNKEEKK